MQDYKKKLLRITIPIMLSNIIAQIQMLIDRIFLGRLDILYMSAVGNATAPIWTTMSSIYSLAMGASILISQSVGAEDMDKAKNYSASLIKFHNVLPVLLFLFWMFCSPFVFGLMGVSENVLPLCVTYTRFYSPIFLIVGIGASYSVVFQTSNYTKPLVAYGLIRSGLNVLLDWLLIFGHWGFPRMEIAGAALGTTIAEYAGSIFLLIIVFVKRKRFTTGPSLKKILQSKVRPYFRSVKLGINAALEDFLWNIGNLFIIRILNSINETAAGIYSIVFTVEVLAVVLIGALGNGTMTVTGEATGASDIKLFRKTVRTTYIWSAILSGIFLLVVSIFPKPMLSLFTKDPSVIEASIVFIILVGVNLFGKAGNIIVGNGIRGYGDTKWMLFTQLAGTFFVVGLAALFVFVFKTGMIGVFLAVIIDEIVRAIINTTRFLKIKF